MAEPRTVVFLHTARTRRRVRKLKAMRARIQRVLVEKRHANADAIVLQNLESEISALGWVLEVLGEES